MVTTIKRDKVVYKNLCDKLHPNRIAGCSDKMYFIISTILGQEWVTCDSSYGEFSITSDGLVIDNDNMLGAVSDFEHNVNGYIDAAKLSPKQTEYFWLLYSWRVTDWRVKPAIKFEVV